jgi:hypothetical protein
MKSFLKILLLGLFALFLYDKFFQYIENRREKQKDPFLHVGCKLAYKEEMGGNACDLCLKRWDVEKQRRVQNILKKWKRIRGKEFDATDHSQLEEMIQIMRNYKVSQID